MLSPLVQRARLQAPLAPRVLVLVQVQVLLARVPLLARQA
jgi:hypothetical protein